MDVLVFCVRVGEFVFSGWGESWRREFLRWRSPLEWFWEEFCPDGWTERWVWKSRCGWEVGWSLVAACSWSWSLEKLWIEGWNVPSGCWNLKFRCRRIFEIEIYFFKLLCKVLGRKISITGSKRTALPFTTSKTAAKEPKNI